MSEWNQKTIEEFRANAGKVGGFFEGRSLLLASSRRRTVEDRPE